MTPFQFLQAIFLSFYSKKLYQDVALQWKGRGFFYLLSLLLLAAAAVGFAWHNYVSKLNTKAYAQGAYHIILGDNEHSEAEKLNRFFKVTSSLPKLEIHHGELVSDITTEHIIYDPLTPHNPLLHITPLENGNHRNITSPLLIAKDGFFLSLGSQKNFVLHYQDIQMGDEGWNKLFSTLASFPDLTIKDGTAHMDMPSPYYVENALGDPVFHFDTTGNSNDIPLQQHDTLYASFLKNEVLFFTHAGHTPLTRSYEELSKDDMVEVFDAMIQKGAGLVSKAGLIALLPITLVLFGVTIAIISLLAVVSMTYARYRNILHLTYKDCQRISAVAFTPALILKAILPSFTLSNLFFFMIALGYLHFAIEANKKYNDKA